jgi:cobyrinic acid a,c-diamide synthase
MPSENSRNYLKGLNKGFIIAAPKSGAGKTTVTLALMAALRRAGVKVQPFKTGPDYIDPSLHNLVCRRSSYNLDTWMMGIDGVRKSFARAMVGADVGVVEGVMGLFDGKSGVVEDGSTAHLAKTLGLPVVLVVDASAMAGSVAPLVKGFKDFDKQVNIAGVILNRVGSSNHYKILKDALSKIKVKVFGYIPRSAELVLPDRHLGLVTGVELRGSKEWRVFIKTATRLIGEHIDIGKLLKAAKSPKSTVNKDILVQAEVLSNHSVIAVARDRAFCFYYDENLDMLRDLGARLRFFSPLEDATLPKGTRGIYLGGGYPELHAKALAANASMKAEVKAFALAGRPVYAECGGLMFLGRRLKDLTGKHYDMAGVFPWTSRMLKRRKRLGYREIVMKQGSPFLKKGGVIRGHEYHYSELRTRAKVETVYKIGKGVAAISEGFLFKQTLASYVHLHFASNPDFALGFVKACAKID